MKAVIALLAALVLLAIGIPLSRAISDGEQHTITRTRDPATPTTSADKQASTPRAAPASRDPRAAQPVPAPR